MARIRTTDIYRAPHRLGKRVGIGKYIVKHPPNCECMLIHSVRHAPWVTYNQMDGWIKCDRCKAEVFLPCPSIRDRIDKRTIYMDLAALADDLAHFQRRHENCPATIK